MAHLIVSCVVDKLADLLVEESHFLNNSLLCEGTGNKINKLMVHLSRMQHSLKDAEWKRRGDEVLKQEWFRDVLNLAYRTDYAIDVFLFKISRIRRNHVPRIPRHILILAELSAFHKLGKKIVKIHEVMHQMYESRNTLWGGNSGNIPDEARPLTQRPAPLVQSFEDEARPLTRRQEPLVQSFEDVVGFEDEERYVVNALVYSSSQRLQTISIVGPGGIGKTTLAQKVYQNTEVQKHFPLRLWFCVSMDAQTSTIWEELHEKITKAWSSEVGSTKSRYLIVLDDIWSEDVFAELIVRLPDDINGSRVLITSRMSRIAELGDPSSIVVKLRFINEEESLELFLKKAMVDRLTVSVELLDVAKQICKRCQGLPAALVALGGLISTKPCTYESWVHVLQNLDWRSEEEEGSLVIRRIKASYDELPDFLKSCFRYLACFPEDYEIPAKYLYKLLIAEGFIVPKGTVTLEDIAEDYLENLAQRSMVEVMDWYTNGTIKSFRVHDLLLDLARSLAIGSDLHAICDHIVGAQSELDAARRVSIQPGANSHNTFQSESSEKMDMPNVRSFLNFGGDVPFPLRFMLVRVLELQGTKNLNTLPKVLQNMIHLKYLGLRSTNITTIPKTIGRLQNLQTLDIRDTQVTYIPVSLWKIRTLRHVHGSKPRKRFLVPDGPPQKANLVKLLTLATFNVPKSWKKGLPHLPSLRKLGLSYYTETKDPRYKPDWAAVISLLGKLRNLESLAIYGEHIPSQILHTGTSPSYQNIRSILLCGHGSKLSLGTLEMPRNLTKLTLVEVELDQDPMPKLAKLPYLEVLQLRSVITVKAMDCPANGFPELRELEIDGSSVEQFKVHEESMPKLTNLIIQNCSEHISHPDL